MKMNILFLEAVILELQARIRGSLVNKIHQPGPDEILLRLWTGRETLRLLLVAAPRGGRLHLTEEQLPNPAVPPRFCQLLRSRLKRLVGIERAKGERIVRLVFSGEGGQHWVLVAEVFGSRPNLILLDAQDRIVDALHRNAGEARGILPGLSYVPPVLPDRFDLSEELPTIPPQGDFRQWLQKAVTPMTPLVAADLAAAVAKGEASTHALDRFRRRLLSGQFTPWIGIYEGKRILSAYLPEHLAVESSKIIASPSAAADAFYRGETRIFSGGRDELDRVVRTELQRLGKRLRHIEREREKALGSDRQREIGDLLLANLHRLHKGMTEIALEDWYADPPQPFTIFLDPALSPQENVERYYRLHRKGKRGLEHTERRLLETRSELEWLQGVAFALEEAEGEEDLAALRLELLEAGLLRTRPEPGRRKAESSPRDHLRHALSPGGFELYWGRNNRSNDYVSRQMTNSDDLWFHAFNMPGCHLTLKRGAHRGPIPEADVLHAAALAAAHCRGKEAGKVEVMVAEGRWVRKPKGAKPGLVVVEHFRTVVVKPRTDSRRANT